jgi:hypothetical protein
MFNKTPLIRTNGEETFVQISESWIIEVLLKMCSGKL